MIELPQPIGLLIIGSILFFVYTLLLGASRNMSRWPKLMTRLLATIILVIFPLSIVAFVDANAAQAQESRLRHSADPQKRFETNIAKGEEFERKGELVRAFASYRAALGVALRMAKANPNNAAWQRSLAFAHRKVGAVQEARGDKAGAAQSYAAALAITARLLANDPSQKDVLASIEADRERVGRLEGVVSRREGQATGASPKEAKPAEPAKPKPTFAPRPYKYEAPTGGATGEMKRDDDGDAVYSPDDSIGTSAGPAAAPPPSDDRAAGEAPDLESAPPPPAQAPAIGGGPRRRVLVQPGALPPSAPEPPAPKRAEAPPPPATSPTDRAEATPADAPEAVTSSDEERGEAAPPPPPAAAARSRNGEHEAAKESAPSARGLAAAEKPAEWDIVPVFYGTDRERDEAKPKREVVYNSERARNLEMGRALVTVPKVHRVPNVERPWVVTIPFTDIVIFEGAEDPRYHFTIKDIAKLDKADFLKLVKERLAAASRFKDHAFVFIHGYNTSFDNAIYRTAQIAYDMQFDGAPFLYSWPSGGKFENYTYDRASAEQSKRFLTEFLKVVCKESGATSVSIIAHSMGNEVLIDVLRDLKNVTPPEIVISQLILAAPDVDRDKFDDLVREFTTIAKGITLYAASNDRALLASRNIWGVPRAGDVPAGGPLLVPGVDTIDVTAASTDVLSLNHSGYATKKALLEDIALLVEKGVRPPDTRFPALKPTKNDKGAWWLYDPKLVPAPAPAPVSP